MSRNDPTDQVDTVSGSELINEINDEHKALLSNDIGSGDPSYVVKGQSFIDDSSTPWIYKFYDGSTSIKAMEIDANNDTVEFQFDDSTTSNITGSTTQSALESVDSKLGTDGDSLNYLDPDGLTISNNSSDSDHDIDTNGGEVWVNNDSGGSFQNDGSGGEVVQLSDESPAFKIDTTGDNGLINSSSLSADTWYELGIIADSSDSNNPSVVGYTDGNRPSTSSDLPSGFDLFRAMGTPGKTWWVKTNGNSNILDFDEQLSDGTLVYGEQFIVDQEPLFRASPPTTGGSVSVNLSNNIPPTKGDIKFNRVYGNASSGIGELGLHDNAISDFPRGKTRLIFDGNDTDNVGVVTNLKISNQTLHFYANSNVNFFEITSVSRFKAV